MWLINFLPNWVFHTLLLAGVLGLISTIALGFIPFIKTYVLPIQLGSILLVVAGVWFEGAISNQDMWEAKVKDLQIKVAEAETQSADANVKIITKVVSKTKQIHDKGDDIIRYVDREVVKNNEVIKFVENCPIPTIIIDTHNAAALNTPIGEKK
jgi:hypothetical protein